MGRVQYETVNNTPLSQTFELLVTCIQSMKFKYMSCISLIDLQGVAACEIVTECSFRNQS